MSIHVAPQTEERVLEACRTPRRRSEIAQELGLGRSTVGFALGNLREAGLVRCIGNGAYLVTDELEVSATPQSLSYPPPKLTDGPGVVEVRPGPGAEPEDDAFLRDGSLNEDPGPCRWDADAHAERLVARDLALDDVFPAEEMERKTTDEPPELFVRQRVDLIDLDEVRGLLFNARGDVRRAFDRWLRSHPVALRFTRALEALETAAHALEDLEA
jgi:hypothetical protein